MTIIDAQNALCRIAARANFAHDEDFPTLEDRLREIEELAGATVDALNAFDRDRPSALRL